MYWADVMELKLINGCSGLRGRAEVVGGKEQGGYNYWLKRL